MIKIEATKNKEINYNPQQKRINEEIFQRSKLFSSPLLKITPIFSLNHISFSTPMEKPILHVLSTNPNVELITPSLSPFLTLKEKKCE